MEIANPAISTATGWPVGFWWSELTYPWLAFTEAGYEAEFFSPDGGACVADAMSDSNDAGGYSRTDLISPGFLHKSELMALVDATRPVAEIAPDRFDAIAVTGGQSPMFRFEVATGLHATFVAFYTAGKIAAALCHGTAVLNYALLLDGQYLVKGKTVTGFARVEEDFAVHALRSYGPLPADCHLMPWRNENALREKGANFVQAGLRRGFAVRDGNLVTGQQNLSGAETARLVIQALGR